MDHALPSPQGGLRERQIEELFGPLETLFRRGEVAYRGYQEHGKSYLHARVIRDTNFRVRETILAKGHLAPSNVLDHLLQIVAHIDVWAELWTALDASRPFALHEPFVFENAHTFPRASLAAVTAHYEMLKSVRKD